MRLLVVEDEAKLARILQRGLEREGYAVDVVLDGRQALIRLQVNHEDYDLAVLDVMLPGMDGLSVCRRLRADGVDLPILVLTARDATADKVAGLDSGADDYLVKPFAFEELLARIRTLLRRPRQALPPVMAIGGLELDPSRHEARCEGAPLALSAKEFGLLELFMRHPGEVLTRDRILDHLWDEEYDAFSNIVDVYVRKLRRKIDVAGAPSRIETLRGAGYRLRAATGPERDADG
jgi:two-component system OmpR family response regulator